MLAVVILAAGRGVRMRSDTPKVLHEAAGRPLLDRVLESALSLGAGPIVVVVGSGREKVLQHLARYPGVTPVVQEPQLGTGDAVRAALSTIVQTQSVVHTVTLTWQIKAKFPIKARTPLAKVYPYYNPERVAIAAPQDLVVTK